MKRSAMRRSRKRINPIGARTRKWRNIRDQVVDPELAARGVFSCEFKGYLPGDCWGRLERAHSMKRRKFHTDEDWAEVALGCHRHHACIEKMLAPDMAREVRAAVARRQIKSDLPPISLASPDLSNSPETVPQPSALEPGDSPMSPDKEQDPEDAAWSTQCPF